MEFQCNYSPSWTPGPSKSENLLLYKGVDSSIYSRTFFDLWTFAWLWGFLQSFPGKYAKFVVLVDDGLISLPSTHPKAEEF